MTYCIFFFYTSPMRRDSARTSVLFLLVFFCLVVAWFVLLSTNSVPEKYPFQEFYQKYSRDSTTYSIAIVADMDKASKVDNKWRSSLIYGTLERNPTTGMYSVQWHHEVDFPMYHAHI